MLGKDRSSARTPIVLRVGRNALGPSYLCVIVQVLTVALKEDSWMPARATARCPDRPI
jgi:hypothetical protein